jgi:uncharacterized membrane protein
MLLMTLTLASTQFSPRILVSFVRARATQWTLGMLLGVFSYCVAVLPAVRSAPHVFVPVVSGDLAVNLRLLRAMGDIAATTGREDLHAMLRERAQRLVERAADKMLESDAARLRDRLARLQSVLNA